MQKHFLFIIYFIVILFCKGFFINLYKASYKRSHRRVFLNQPSPQNVRKISTKEICDDSFAALVTALRTITISSPTPSPVFSLIIHIKNIHKIDYSSLGFTKNGRLKDALIEHTTVFFKN